MTGSNATNVTNSTHIDGSGHGSGEPTAILFIFFSCALGAVIRTVLHKVRLPYTVVLMLLGCVIGLISRHVPLVAHYTTLASLDPHTILNVFLPVLIFESAFAMEIHMFMKSFVQIIVLAIPGLVLASFMTCVFSMYVFSYNWTWQVGMMFGALASATDPVAVVALLKDVGASKQLGTIIEGESLLNDGAAIVVFNVFQIMAVPGSTFSGLDICVYFIRVALGGPLLGFVMGKLTTLWLVNIFNDALTEITITLCSTYLTFYVGEVWLNVSGVLAVVVLGVTVSSERTSISPEVEAFLHRFWEMLAYLANTLIFILVGVVITEKAIQHSELEDWFLLGALYCMVFVIRALVLALFSPLLARIGYGMTWRSAAVMTWGGLRGAVGLALALILLQNHEIDPTGNTQNKILLHCAGLVTLTLTVNATTVAPLLRILGMNEISIPKRLAMASAVRNLKDVAQTSLNSYKTDRFLADADWDIVMKYIEISDPYKTVEEEAALDDLTNFHRTSLCPVCSTHVANEPSSKEWEEMQNEARLRLLKAEKVSYWRQFEHGMVSREAVRRLVELVDTAGDTTDPTDDMAFINTDEIKKNWEIKGIYDLLKKRFEMWQHQKPDQETVIWPENKVLRMALRICIHPAFDIIMYILIMLNIVFVIMELVVESTLTPEVVVATYGIMFEVLNYIFIVIYVFEAIIKLVAYRVNYFKNKWNVCDFIILLLSIVDLALELTIFQGANPYFDPNILKIAKTIRLMRLLRSLRLVKGLIPQIIDFLNHQINKKLRLGYDVGKGYITGEEDVHNYMEIMVDNRKISRDLKARVNKGRLEIMKELGMLQKTHPGIAVSIKTQQAARRILNNIRDKISTLRCEGVLDEVEGHKLEIVVEMKMKMLQKIPATIHPPPPEKIIGNLSWVAGDEDLLEYIKQNSQLVSMQEGEELDVESDPRGGIYVVISGLIKVDKFVEDYTHSKDDNNAQRRQTLYQADQALDFDRMKQTAVTIEKVSDYLSTGSVLGEFSLLTGKPSNTVIMCDTSLQMYHIPYEAIQSALELFTEPPSLEYRLWRVAAMRIAVPIIKKQVFFRSWSYDRIKMHLEKCVIVMKKWELSEGSRSLKPFVFDLRALMMSDVVLIHGYAQSPDTGDLYQGPCYIPQALNTLHLLPGRTEKHILVILSRDVTVNLEEENPAVGEEEDPHVALRSAMEKGRTPGAMAAERSSLCLLHSAHERQELEVKASDHRYQMSHENGKQSLVRKVSSLLNNNNNGQSHGQNRRDTSNGINLEQGMIRDHSYETGKHVHIDDAQNMSNNSATGALSLKKIGPLPPLPPLPSKLTHTEVLSIDITTTPQPSHYSTEQTPKPGHLKTVPQPTASQGQDGHHKPKSDKSPRISPNQRSTESSPDRQLTPVETPEYKSSSINSNNNSQGGSNPDI